LPFASSSVIVTQYDIRQTRATDRLAAPLVGRPTGRLRGSSIGVATLIERHREARGLGGDVQARAEFHHRSGEPFVKVKCKYFHEAQPFV
jgi:hypothetical protein